VQRPFEICGIDLTELKESERGNKFILVVMDHYTRFVEMFPLPDKSAITVGRCLKDEIFTRYGWPESILNDNGTEFDNSLISALCEMGATKRMFTSPYHPETNGMCERFMRTMKSRLRTSVSEFHHDWDNHLPAIRLAYNTAVHSSTASTPGYLMFGRTLRTVADERFRAPVAAASAKPSADAAGLLAEAKRWAAILDRHRAWSNDVSRKKQEKRAAKVDEASKDNFHKYRVGDWVMKANHAHDSASSRKLNLAFSGPYQIIRRVSETDDNVFVLDDGDTRNADQLRPFVHGDEEIASGEYEVDYLYKEKYDNNKQATVFRVRWKGYQLKDDSWVPEFKITSPSLISEFKERNKDLSDDFLRKEKVGEARLRHSKGAAQQARAADAKV
jgi:hypothetical protein